MSAVSARRCRKASCPFDDLIDEATANAPSSFTPDRRDNPALHVAVITFDMTADGIVPVARSHAELLAGGLSVLAESRLAPDSPHVVVAASGVLCRDRADARAVASVAPGRSTCISRSMRRPWRRQLQDAPCDVAILPGPLVAQLAEAKLFATPHAPKNILAFWRAPERLAFSASMLSLDSTLIDIPLFGEIGLCCSAPHRRQARAYSCRKARSAAGRAGAVVVASIARTPAGTLGFGGPMAPHHPFPHAAGFAGSYFKTGDDGALDTGFPCRIDKETGGLVVTGPPAGLFSIGGYRFAMHDVQQVVAQADKEANVAALPDTFAGHRLAGHSKDRAAVRHTLDAVGLNPLIVRAFRDRTGTPSAA